MNRIDTEYQDLLAYILGNGVEKKDRTGTGTISIFGWQIRHDMREGFPLLTTKKMAWKSVVTELLWFLRGDTNIKYLVDNGCHIWDGDAYKNFVNRINQKHSKYYIPIEKEKFIERIKEDEIFAKQWGELGPIYGKQWRSWTNRKYGPAGFRSSQGHDQIANLISELKTNPDSRRLMVNAWNVAELDQMVLPPCHYGFQVYTRELSLDERRALVTPEMHARIYTGGDSSTLSHSEIDQWNISTRAISLMWNQRSVDTFLGLPFNIASYGLLLEIIAKEVNMVPEELIGNLGDVHLYSNHIEQAKEQIRREPFELPKINFIEKNWFIHEKVKESIGDKTFSEKIEGMHPENFELVNYKCHPAIKAPLSN
jgi:thymidylate synthase